MTKKELLAKVREMALFQNAISLVSEEERKIIEARMDAFADMFCKSVLSPAGVAAARARAQESAQDKTKKDPGNTNG